MSNEIAYALGALVCYGLGDVIYKRAASAGLGSDYFLMGQAWFFCSAAVVYTGLSGTFEFSLSALWGTAAGLLTLIGLYNYSRSLRLGAVSTIAPVFRLNFIVTAALAIGWLREPMTTPKLSGILLALIAGWLLLSDPRQRVADPRAALRPLIRVIGATLAMGAANFCYKLGLVEGATPETLLSVQAVVFTSFVTAMTYIINGTVRPPAGLVSHSGPAAIAVLAAFLFMLYGLKHGDASVVVPIAQMGFVVAALLGILFFKEAWTGRKLAGIGAAIAALLALAIG